MDADELLLSWTGFLFAVTGGHVAVCAGQTDRLCLIGEVTICPGNYPIADIDGAVVIPNSYAEKILLFVSS